MKITKIEIKNFKAFYGLYEIDLANKGKNLLIYGENGSGKSSLFAALQLFLESADKNHAFEKHQNIFIPTEEGHVKLTLTDAGRVDGPYTWSRNLTDTHAPVILEASKIKGFFDYKQLLETHFVHRKDPQVNIFNLLINAILANTINDVTNRCFIDEWNEIKHEPLPRGNAKKKIQSLKIFIQKFNDGLSIKLTALKKQTAELLQRFEHAIEIEIIFNGLSYDSVRKQISGQEIFLEIKLFTQDIDQLIYCKTSSWIIRCS